jgi:predicted dehydrogenase
MASEKLRVAIVGCGQIADAHLQEVKKIHKAHVVAVCDQFPELALQAAERFGVSETYNDVGKMLDLARPDVVHVTTPPHTHAPLASQALAAGAHVYVEKPFALNVAEADTVLEVAKEHNRLVCVGHDQLFDPCWAELQERYIRGDLGEVVHVDSVMGYDLSGPFGQLMAGDPAHWIHRLPGGLFQNNVSHAVYKVTEFLRDNQPRVWATWFATTGSAPTELRVLLRGSEVTANILFSSTARPVQRVVRVYGTRACAEVDFDGRVLRWVRPAGLPGALAKLEMPWRHLSEAGRSLGRQIWRFLRSDLQYFAGMNRLFRAFYRAIATGGQSPTPPGDIRRVTAIMDQIFEVCRQPDADPADPAGQTAIITT